MLGSAPAECLPAMSDATAPISPATEFRGLVRLALPLVINNLALAGMGFFDTVMSGRISPEALAAVAVGSSVWMLLFLIALGILMAISPLGARHVGGGRPEEVGRYARQGFWLSQVLGLFILLTGQFAMQPLLTLIGIDPAFRDTTVAYLAAISWAAPAVCAYLVLRYTTEAVGRTLPVMVVSVIGLGVNVFGNWVFMFGNLGAPELGAVGAGVASAINLYVMFAVMLGYMYFSPSYAPFRIFKLGRGPQWRYLGEIVVLGVPIMVSMVAEAGLFAAVSLIMGTLSATIAAAHQVALNYASTMFMIPLGMNSATTVLVSQAIGRHELALARARGYLGIAACGLFMMVSAAVMLLFPDQIVGLYTDDGDVHAIAMTLLAVAAIFQVSDGVQVGAAGALRGLQDTRMPMLLTTLSYWVIAFPLALAAATVWQMPPAMIWVGFVVGLTVAAVLLVTRYAWASRQTARLAALAARA